MRAIDINADLGESLGNWPMGNDEALIPLITSANVACGFHASDPTGTGQREATSTIARLRRTARVSPPQPMPQAL